MQVCTTSFEALFDLSWPAPAAFKDFLCCWFSQVFTVTCLHVVSFIILLRDHWAFQISVLSAFSNIVNDHFWALLFPFSLSCITVKPMLDLVTESPCLILSSIFLILLFPLSIILIFFSFFQFTNSFYLFPISIQLLPFFHLVPFCSFHFSAKILHLIPFLSPYWANLLWSVSDAGLIWITCGSLSMISFSLLLNMSLWCLLFFSNLQKSCKNNYRELFPHSIWGVCSRHHAPSLPNIFKCHFLPVKDILMEP